MPESIYVVSRDYFDEEGLPTYGFLKRNLEDLQYVSNNMEEAARTPLLEHDSSLLQIIPYCVLTHKNMILSYQRAGTEKRLHKDWSIGFGGHWNTQYDTIYKALTAELQEEIGYAESAKVEMHGLIYDGTTAVGAVHLGVLLSVELEDISHLTLPTEEIKEVDYVFHDEAILRYLEFERWSRIALEVLPALGVVK